MALRLILRRRGRPRAPAVRPRNLLLLPLLGGLCLFGCKSEDEEIDWVKPPALRPGSAPQAKTPDRLPPGDVLEGSERVFGFAVPRGMKMVRPTQRSAYITGRVDYDKLVDYVKDRIIAQHAEMLPRALVFRNAAIKGTKERVFDVTVMDRDGRCAIKIQEETPLPPTHGLSERERLKQVGLKPGGGLIDPNAME